MGGEGDQEGGPVLFDLNPAAATASMDGACVATPSTLFHMWTNLDPLLLQAGWPGARGAEEGKRTTSS